MKRRAFLKGAASTGAVGAIAAVTGRLPAPSHEPKNHASEPAVREFLNVAMWLPAEATQEQVDAGAQRLVEGMFKRGEVWVVGAHERREDLLSFSYIHLFRWERAA